jgi:acyl-CoA synthetase (AMP-forming)/AMP-acid ligase II
VCAVVVPAGPAVDLVGVAAHTRAQLSAYKVPTRWAVTTSDRLPTLPSGKFSRRLLGAMLADGSLPSQRP